MTMTRYEMAPGGQNVHAPSSFASRAFDWVLDGFEPPELKEVRARKK